MVAGRAHRAKGVVDLAAKHRLGSRHRRAGRAQRRAPGSGADNGVRVEVARLAVGLHLLHELTQLQHVICAMCALQLRQRGQWRLALLDRYVQPRSQQLVGNGIQPLRALRVACAHIVQTALSMAVERCRHCCL